ncbi:hypothetical protein TNCV_3692931 [Trichonephila clavipes]|nr:hypothetical protein TNCV_3692931 [Trichonephila clavipes]
MTNAREDRHTWKSALRNRTTISWTISQDFGIFSAHSVSARLASHVSVSNTLTAYVSGGSEVNTRRLIAFDIRMWGSCSWCDGLYLVRATIGNATAGSDVVQSGRPIFDDFFQHLWPYIGNNTANVVFQMVKCLWLIRIDQ